MFLWITIVIAMVMVILGALYHFIFVGFLDYCRRNHLLVYQMWEVFQLYRLYLYKKDFSNTIYNRRFYLRMLYCTPEQKKNQRQWFRDSIAATLKGIRKNHFKNGNKNE